MLLVKRIISFKVASDWVILFLVNILVLEGSVMVASDVN